MLRYLFAILLLFMSLPSPAQKVQAYKATELMSRLNHADTVYVVNFWATWCAPCVKELPLFDTVQQHFAQQPVKVLLVSLDFKEDYLQKLQTYRQKKHPLPEIVWLNETNAESFIPVIDNRWGGALPATMIYVAGKRYSAFVENTVHTAQVVTITDSALHTLR